MKSKLFKDKQCHLNGKTKRQGTQYLQVTLSNIILNLEKH